jgi:dTDP-4-dehydrorhamnose 3,5-epimerase
MIFQETRLSGAYVILPEKRSDDRGFFARTWCTAEFGARGLTDRFVQSSISFSPVRGTLRGLHFQRPPHAETKLIRCTRGAIYDVIVDLRPESRTYGQWLGLEMRAGAGEMLYVPERFAHGFQTLQPDTEVDYMMSAAHAPDAATGLRHDDPLLDISWPLAVTRISERDRSWPLLAPEGAPSQRRRPVYRPMRAAVALKASRMQWR